MDLNYTGKGKAQLRLDKLVNTIGHGQVGRVHHSNRCLVQSRRPNLIKLEPLLFWAGNTIFMFEKSSATNHFIV